MKSQLALFSLLAIMASSCGKNFDKNADQNTGGDLGISDSSIAPASFNFSTTKPVSLNIKLATNNDEAIAGVPVSIYAGDPLTTSPIYTALSDANGAIIGSVNLPQYIDTLTVDPQYVGLMRYAKVLINSNAVTATIGGKNAASGNVIESNFKEGLPSIKSPVSGYRLGGASTIYSYMGAYDSYGVPKYLEAQNDVISSKLLSYINASLPEAKPVPTYHPTYLKSGNITELNVNALADVWITFVSEGAGYLNTLGYYTYPTGNKPTKVSDIDSIHYIYPNASLPNSGGNLSSGSKVKLGRFPAGVSIGFVLLANGWNGSAVNNGTAKYYSEPSFNPEASTTGLQQHSVLLYDDADKLFLVGFEDVNRTSSSCDNDFNDIVFYATSNPVTALSREGVQETDVPGDADKDGITDKYDQYPNDAARAFDNYYPSQTTFGTLAFEDLWPATGDYDVNDLVVGYRYKYVTNGKGNVVEMWGNYHVKAAGAIFQNGFGVQFPFSPSMVSQVTGQKLVSNYINKASNGTEASQSKAVIIPFDNYTAMVSKPSGFMVNTQKSAPAATSDTASVYVVFTSPISLSTFGAAPFNPFLISNLRRGYEVHLPGSLPTDLASTKLFNTGMDYTHPSQNYYYKTKNAWPWALSFAEKFDYPSEGNAINTTYNYFLRWAQSGGTSYTNWYKDVAGNRNNSLIYKK